MKKNLRRILSFIFMGVLICSLVIPVGAVQDADVTQDKESADQEPDSADAGDNANQDDKKNNEDNNDSSSGSSQSSGSTSGTTTSKKLESTKDELNKAEKEKNSIQSGLSDIKEIKERLEQSSSDLKGYVTELDSSLNQIMTKLSSINQLIEQKEEEIKRTKLELDKAIEEEELQYEAMKKRIKFMYERGSVTYLDMFLSSKSFGDMLNMYDYIEKLQQYDNQVLLNYQVVQEQITELGKQLEEEEDVLKTAKEAVESEQANIKTLINEKREQIETYEDDIADKEKLIKEYETELAEQSATIAALEAAVEAEQKRIESLGQNSNIKYDGGMFTWPAPSYTRISSDYGMRMHPTLGVEKFHNGVDMAAPTGSPVLAAYDGVVVGASYNASMGNYIMINHGNGLYTIYMHCNSLSVSNGQEVSAGAQIGTVGSTGRSTGPHLHFTVRLNGEYVSPWGYL